MRREALSGVRVIDFSWVLAGPLTTRYLAQSGAEVIKIESIHRIDPLRMNPPFMGEPGVNSSALFSRCNPRKKSLTLNMRDPRAREVVRRLVPHADVVIDNFTPQVMDEWGFGYDALRELRDDIIVMKLSMFGAEGSWSTAPGYGMTLSALLGFAGMTGWADREPLLPAGAYTDFIVPRIATSVLAAALLHRKRTGQGQLIDLSQCATSSLFMTGPVLDHVANGRDWSRAGNRAPGMAPHGVYRCAGEERWIAIAVETDAQWLALRDVMGDPSWAADPTFASVAGRLAQVEAIDEAVDRWTRTQERDDLEARLLAAGVPAGIVATAADVAADPQLRHRGFFQTSEHPQMGSTSHNGRGFRMLGTPLASGPSPVLGEHTAELLVDVCGYSDDEFATLVAEGVLE